MSNFDKQIKQQGEAFSIEPRAQVWHRVEAELDKKKDRRIVGWWWTAPAILLIGGGVFYYAVTHKENKQQPVVSNNQPATSTAILPAPKTNHAIKEQQAEAVIKGEATNPVTANLNTIKKNELPHSIDRILPNTPSALRFNKNKTTLTPANPNNIIHAPSNAASLAALDAVKQKETRPGESAISNDILAATATILQSNKSISNTRANNDIQSGNNLLTEKNSAPTTNSIVDSTSIAAINEDVTILKDSAAETTKNIAIAKPVKEKIKWRLTVSGGFTNNTENDVPFLPFLSDQNKAFAADPQNNTGGGTNQSAAPLPVQPNKAGASFSVALQRLQWLGQRWQWQAGFGAQYHQIQQTTGIRKDSTINQSASNNFSYRADYFYSGGSSISHTGANYRIFLSNDFAFSLLKHKRSLLLNAGIYAGYNIYNNYLVPDYNNRLYIKSENLYNKWLAGIDFGLEYNFKNRMSLGFLIKHDLTKSFTTLGGDKQYWQSFLFNIGIPLSKK